MRITNFLQSLFEHGRVTLENGPFALDASDWRAAQRLLHERADAVASEFPGPAPAMEWPRAQWAAVQLYMACHFVLFRDEAPEKMLARLNAPVPGDPLADGPNAAPESGAASAARDQDPAVIASRHYSVDLLWRFLPDVDRLACALAPSDPLRSALRAWGAAYPLSSVGMANVAPDRVEEILRHRGLRQSYVDRVIQREDASRLTHPLVRDEVQAALGAAGMRGAAWAVAAVAPSAPITESIAPIE